jgi:pilus assembly protein FimV
MRLPSTRIKALHAAIVVAGGTLVSANALALVLGDIALSSGLNEPLEAVIELDSLEGVDAEMITVTVGDQAAYDRVNMDRPSLLDDIEFTVEVDNDDTGRIRLSSTQSINEPFLNLIVSVDEPGGITLREYTLLMELPAESAVTQAEPAPAAPAVASQSPAAAAGAESYTVTAGDTLYQIAQSTRPDASVGVEQMMLAIQRANPDAFSDGDINRLVTGRVLRIPSQQDINAVDQRSAVAQVTQQNGELGGQPLAAGGTTTNNNGGDERDQLSVLTNDDAPAAGGGSSDLAATIRDLENQLMLSEESLDRARIENLELTNRLSALQEQIDLLENIIAIEDERIAGLQAELSQQAAATENALASADSAASELAAVNDTPASGLTGFLQNTVALLGAGVLLVLAALGFLFYRRKQALADAEANSFNPALADVEPVAPDVEKPSFLAGLLARFRRNKAEDDYTDEEADAIIAAQEAAGANAAASMAAPKKDSTDNLLDDMGISEEMLSLDDALDDIDSDAEQGQEEVEAFEPVEEESTEETASTETAEQKQDSDYAMTAATAAFATIDAPEAEPEAAEFNTTDEVAAPVDVPAEAAPLDSADTFEFTLKDLPEDNPAPAQPVAAEKIESFDFKLSTPAAAPAPEPAAAKPDALEVIAFPGASTKPAAAPAPAAEEDLSLELGDLSFDDTMLTDESAGESEYKPRTGNECDTKLDLATAYEAMGDVVEAIEILDEVIAEGSPEQVETAQRLKETWQASL